MKRGMDSQRGIELAMERRRADRDFTKNNVREIDLRGMSLTDNQTF